MSEPQRRFSLLFGWVRVSFGRAPLVYVERYPLFYIGFGFEDA